MKFYPESNLFNAYKYVTSLKTVTVSSRLAERDLLSLIECFSFPESNSKSHAYSMVGTFMARSRGNYVKLRDKKTCHVFKFSKSLFSKLIVGSRDIAFSTVAIINYFTRNSLPCRTQN